VPDCCCAQCTLDEVTASVVTGQYVDPKAGRTTFREYAERWRAGQVHRPSTQAYIETNLRRHAYPVLGDRPQSSVRPTDVQAWVKGMAGQLAPSTVGTVHGVVSGIFRAAMRIGWLPRTHATAPGSQRPPRRAWNRCRSKLCSSWRLPCRTGTGRW
jgi:hypothetical protein